mmetsp:Transcript_89426/g.164024  ORF Transcript_89426/g.164024 Transcript_89426/m.164024 type:complete len:226 (-) Transcript_89426:56-733(-)
MSLTMDNEGFHGDGIHNMQTGLPAITSMYCLEAPEQGGETHFACGRKALAQAKPEVYALAKRMKIHYIYDEGLGLPIMRDGIVRTGREMPAGVATGSSLHTVHPLVRVHPETGNASVYISCGNIDYIEARATDTEAAVHFDTTASYNFVEELLGSVTQPPLVYAHRWKKGDFVIWDNRLTLHSPGIPERMIGKRLHHRVRLTGSKHANRDLEGPSELKACQKNKQ